MIRKNSLEDGKYPFAVGSSIGFHVLTGSVCGWWLNLEYAHVCISDSQGYLLSASWSLCIEKAQILLTWGVPKKPAGFDHRSLQWGMGLCGYKHWKHFTRGVLFFLLMPSTPALKLLISSCAYVSLVTEVVGDSQFSFWPRTDNQESLMLAGLLWP